MNILIESGATKSTCIGFNGTCTFFTYKTTGINASYAEKESIFALFEDIIAKNNIAAHEVEHIRYYGAGCFSINNAEKVKEVLRNLFPCANITVLSDLYAACHALCKNQKGFAGILGTGSASCFYDGIEIINKTPSLGFLLGDEGSGIHLGKQFVKNYLNDKIDIEIAKEFEVEFSVSKTSMLEKIYREPKPQTFFASIPFFLHKHQKNTQIRAIITGSFQDFFEQQIEYYGKMEYPWFFCGSIAYHFQNILKEIVEKHDIKVGGIIQECAPYLLCF